MKTGYRVKSTMIKEKQKNKLKRLEDKLPKYGGADDGIPITTEAEQLLQPYTDAFERLDGQTLYFKRPEREGCIYLNAPEKDSVTVNETLWIRTMGAAIALEGEEETVINARVARYMVERFIEYGIE